MGRYLANQRELRGIGLDELARLTKIPRRSLERLESGAFDAQPDGFARGFVRTVAAALGLDTDEAVARLLREPPEDATAAEARAGARRLAAGGAAGLLLLGALSLGLAWLSRDAPEPVAAAPEPPSDVVYRTDAVRALVEERAAPPAGPEPPPGP